MYFYLEFNTFLPFYNEPSSKFFFTFKKNSINFLKYFVIISFS